MNIAAMIAKYEARKLAAERQASDAKSLGAKYLKALEANGLDRMTADQTKQFEELTAKNRAAVAEIRECDGAIKALRETEAEDAEYMRRASESHPNGVKRNGPSGTVRPGASIVTRDRDESAPTWRRTDDGRPAVVERNQRFADHEVAREIIENNAGRDEHTVAMFGDIGQQLRALTTTTGSAIVPTVWASQIIDRARNYAAVYQAGAQPVVMDRKIVQIGRLTVDPVAGFRTEGSTITASDPTFDNVTLTSKSLNALVVGSMEWFADANNAGEVVTEALAKALALQIDLVALFGGVTTGAEQTTVGNNLLASGGLPNPPNPTGILANLLANASTSVLGSATNGTVQTAATFYKEVLDTIYTPRDFNEAPNALLWPSHLARIYAEAVNTLNDPMRVPADVDNIPKFVTNQIPSGFTQGTGTLMSDIVVGDFTQLLIGQRLDLTVQTLTERYAELGQVALLATWRGDVQLARPRAFSVYRYIKGT